MNNMKLLGGLDDLAMAIGRTLFEFVFASLSKLVWPYLLLVQLSWAYPVNYARISQKRLEQALGNVDLCNIGSTIRMRKSQGLFLSRGMACTGSRYVYMSENQPS